MDVLCDKRKAPMLCECMGALVVYRLVMNVLVHLTSPCVIHCAVGHEDVEFVVYHHFSWLRGRVSFGILQSSIGCTIHFKSMVWINRLVYFITCGLGYTGDVNRLFSCSICPNDVYILYGGIKRIAPPTFSIFTYQRTRPLS